MPETQVAQVLSEVTKIVDNRVENSAWFLKKFFISVSRDKCGFLWQMEEANLLLLKIFQYLVTSNNQSNQGTYSFS